ncbi:hypothetical protein AB0I49_29510 [Streptomyces sp. NPDC050617]|uniref:hypothetical protein n=1 Tax=Streptomyces sp. NPDC050617 TaxID=3154628 RepID=UPI00343FD91A
MGRTARIAVVATPFGFGPASKAHAITQVLTGRYGMRVQYYGAGSAGDFFDAQGGARARPIGVQALEREPGLLAGYDAILNVLAPELIRSPETAGMTYYVDSLGFMWQPADIAAGSLLRRVRGYFAQDVFGSAAHLTALGVPGVRAVSGIVAPPALPAPPTRTAPPTHTTPATPATPPVPSSPPDPAGPPTGRASEGGAPARARTRAPARVLAHLGGLGNPAGNGSAHAYLPLVRQLLGGLRRDDYELTVAMNQAGDTFRLAAGTAVRHLSGTDFQQALADCATVLSSPGLTTLIEASQAGRPYVPLPPQNWSQVVICEHMSRHSGQAVWPFLAERYRAIDVRAAEAAKAAAVREVNRDLAVDAEFVREYGLLARRAVREGEVPAVGAPFRGAAEVAAAVAADLGVSAGAGYLSMNAGAR